MNAMKLRRWIVGLVLAIFAGFSVAAFAQATISESFNPGSIPVGGTSQLKFTMGASLNTAPTGVGFADTLPAGLVIATANNLSFNCGVQGNYSAPAAGTSISVSGVSIPFNSDCVVFLNVVGTAAGQYTNTTSAITSDQGTGNTASANLTVVAPPGIAAAFNPSSMPVNGTSTLTITIANPAANTVALSGVAFTDTLPANMVVATPNGLTNTCSGTPTAVAGSGSISLTGGTVAANQTCDVTVNVTAALAANYSDDTGPVSTSNGGSGNAASATLTVVAPPTIAKSFNPTSIEVKGSTALTFNIANPNAGQSLSGVAFTDTLPSGMTVASPAATTNTCNGTLTATAGAGNVSLSGGTLAASGTCTITISVTESIGGTANNTTGAISSTEGGTGSTSNTASLNVTVPVLTIQKTGPGNVYAGSNITYTIVVSNTGNAPASNVMLTDPTPAGLSFVSATSPCTGGFPCSLGTLNAPGSVTVMATYTIATTTIGTTTNTASVQSDQTAATSASATTTTESVPIPTPVLDWRGLLLLGLAMLLGGAYWQRRRGATRRH